MSLKKIAVLHRYPPNLVVGTNASFMEFLKRLSVDGIETYYVTYKDLHKGAGDDKDALASTEIKGLQYKYLPFTFDRWNGFDKKLKTYLWILLVPFYVRKLQRQYNLDLVYCDDSVPVYGFLTKLISRKSKVIIRLGDLQTAYILADNHPVLFKIVSFFEKLMWKYVDGIIAISDAFKYYCIKKGISAEKIRVVYESINLEEVNTPKDYKDIPNSGVFMFHGALVPCKGIETLIDAFKIMNEKYPKISLKVCGGGDINKYKNYALNKGVNNVSFTGQYDHNQLNDLMRDVQIAIAMRSGNMGNDFVVTTCLLENWAYGKPVIAPKLKAIAGVVKNRKNGLLFEPGNVHDLSEKMEYLYSNTNTYEELVRNGYDTAKSVFDHKKIAEDMVTCIRKYFDN